MVAGYNSTNKKRTENRLNQAINGVRELRDMVYLQNGDWLPKTCGSDLTAPVRMRSNIISNRILVANPRNKEREYDLLCLYFLVAQIIKYGGS